jgi:hypothetical protein
VSGALTFNYANEIRHIRQVLSRATGTGWQAAYRMDVGALLDEVERLRLDRADIAHAYAFARDKATAIEREAVVAWLHDEEYHILALAIERGEHCREGEP